MKMRMEATKQLTTVDGVPARIWIATTAGGVPCLIWVCKIEARADDDVEKLEREMHETLPDGKYVPWPLAG